MTQGIVVLSDANQEAYLPWWWEHYTNHASFPVTFFDIGMTKSARNWCQSKGTVIPLTLPEVAPKKAIDPELSSHWEQVYPGPIWQLRPAWFAKPFALQKSPYQYTLYFDIDCCIQKSITPLFDFAKQGFALIKHVLDIGTYHNSGVLAFKQNSPILNIWADTCRSQSHLHLGDDDALRHLVDNHHLDFTFFPIDYNWPDLLDGSQNAVIRHYLGPLGKQKILSSV